MYLVEISIHPEKIDDKDWQDLIDAHQAWYQGYAKTGTFLLTGPLTDKNFSGIILTKPLEREELDHILAEDAYYNDDLATYTVHTFNPGFISDDITNYQGGNQ